MKDEKWFICNSGMCGWGNREIIMYEMKDGVENIRMWDKNGNECKGLSKDFLRKSLDVLVKGEELGEIYDPYYISEEEAMDKIVRWKEESKLNR